MNATRAVPTKEAEDPVAAAVAIAADLETTSDRSDGLRRLDDRAAAMTWRRVTLGLDTAMALV